MSDEKNDRKDAGKARLDLVPGLFVRAVAEVLAFGATKYEAWGWVKSSRAGKPWSRDYAALQRHLTAWHGRLDEGRGPGMDPETGLSHLWHAACDLMFLVAAEARAWGTDDRPDLGGGPARVTSAAETRDCKHPCFLCRR